jgi:hypothetical protein
MAQKQRRRRKHKGTQAGTVRRRSPTSRAQARGGAERGRQERQNRPPTWNGSITRGAIAAAALFVLLAVVLRSPIGSAIALTAVAMLLYVPAFHFVDSALYRRREAKRAAEVREARD